MWKRYSMWKRRTTWSSCKNYIQLTFKTFVHVWLWISLPPFSKLLAKQPHPFCPPRTPPPTSLPSPSSMSGDVLSVLLRQLSHGDPCEKSAVFHRRGPMVATSCDNDESSHCFCLSYLMTLLSVRPQNEDRSPSTLNWVPPLVSSSSHWLCGLIVSHQLQVFPALGFLT